MITEVIIVAQPRVFISSTYYDLKYVRSSLELFVNSLGFEAVLSEQGGVPYAPDRALDESCYREVQNCDIYVLIIGGRYGSEASSTRATLPREFFERYESVTKLEYKSAADKDIPIYVLVEKAVYAEYQTFQKNRDAEVIRYAHVDSVNVYRFIDEILAQPRNNPIQTFDKYSDMEGWLRIQWAGLFRELMQRMSSQQQIATLAGQVTELAELNKTLQRYLEEVVGKVAPRDARKIIKAENERLAEAAAEQALRRNTYVRYLIRRGAPFEAVREALDAAEDFKQLKPLLEAAWTRHQPEAVEVRVRTPGRARESDQAFRDLNDARLLMGKQPFPVEEPDASDEALEGSHS